jgi:hypothetical protein
MCANERTGSVSGASSFGGLQVANGRSHLRCRCLYVPERHAAVRSEIVMPIGIAPFGSRGWLVMHNDA